jgi:hypothetical protein
MVNDETQFHHSHSNSNYSPVNSIDGLTRSGLDGCSDEIGLEKELEIQ